MNNTRILTGHSSVGSHIFPITLFSIFFAAILILVSAGSIIYVGLVSGQTENNETRGSLSYISARLKSGDLQNGVAISKGPEGDSLVLSTFDEDGNAYETRIYLYNGNLCEEYGFAEAPVSPESASVIGKTSSFEISFMKENLLRLSTQQGEVKIAVRNSSGVTER